MDTVIHVPTPFQVGAVNSYLLGDTLIDAGPHTANALDILRKEVDFKSIKNILITHGHVDHHGIAFYLKKVSNCRVFVHKDDFLAVSDFEEKLLMNLEKYKEFLENAGIPREIILGFERFYTNYRRYGENCEAETLEDEFETVMGVLKVIHTPGHTPGSCCFLLGETLYSGDTLLSHISTNPSVHALFDERCGLKTFQRSLERIQGLPITEVLPGHGKKIEDHKKRIQEILEEHTKRREKVINCLKKDPQPLLMITKKVFGEVPISEIILALAECYDHLRVLEKEGVVTSSDSYFFSLP